MFSFNLYFSLDFLKLFFFSSLTKYIFLWTCTDFCLVIFFSPSDWCCGQSLGSGIMLTWFWILPLRLSELCDLGQVSEPLCVSSSSSVKWKLQYLSHEVLWRALKYTFHYEMLQTQIRNTENVASSPMCSPCSCNSVDVLDTFVSLLLSPMLPPSHWVVLKQIPVIMAFYL